MEISKITLRRFVLGKQGLFPGRRWRGQEGVAEALQAGVVVQLDPLAVVARSHDIVLYGRVLDYEPSHLYALQFSERRIFDYGGTVTMNLMEELPYWRVVMDRKWRQPRRQAFFTEQSELIERVLAAVRERGPLSARDFGSSNVVRTGLTKGSFRSGNAVNRALYYLWIAGEIMTHSRKGLERVYDLRERVSPARFDYAATPDEADEFFELKVLQETGIVSPRSWKNWFAGTVERTVSWAEATARLERLQREGKIVPVILQDAFKMQHFLLAEDLPLLETLQAGGIPEAWRPLENSTSDEMVFLAPLEIVSARGRAQTLFDFEYIWEVYKPQEKRRWGYYTLPILYQDTLVARTDLRLERQTKTLVVKGFWLEKQVELSDAFLQALARAFQRFKRFLGAEQLDSTTLASSSLPQAVKDLIASL
jgi:uncharacterized protein YcaQ